MLTGNTSLGLFEKFHHNHVTWYLEDLDTLRYLTRCMDLNISFPIEFSHLHENMVSEWYFKWTRADLGSCSTEIYHLESCPKYSRVLWVLRKVEFIFIKNHLYASCRYWSEFLWTQPVIHTNFKIQSSHTNKEIIYPYFTHIYLFRNTAW